LNIPEDDDAHLVFTAIPSPTSEEEEGQEEVPDWITNYASIEGYIFGQTLELTKQRQEQTRVLARKFPEQPTGKAQKAMESFMTAYEGESKTGCQIKLSNPISGLSRTMDTHWFTPVVVNHIRKAVRAHKEERESSPLEGITVCMINSNDDYTVQFVMDTVMTSEDPYGEDDDKAASSKDATFKGTHLTPLAEQLEESMAAAKSVIKEMNYMERREARMRLTADSINSRVRFFSYISVGILLVVTYVQVTYLKRYFRKKKLL
jgi:hypothetical protein